MMPPTPITPRKRLRDSHVGEKMENLRVLVTLAPWMFIVLAIVEWLMGLSMAEWLLALFVINPLIIYLVARMLRGAFEGTASTFLGTLLSTRGTPHTREFSEMESLIVRGQFTEAAERYREFLIAFPHDTDAWIRLAVLTAEQLKDPGAATAHFLRARETKPSASQETLIGNGLIDLYRAAGDRHALRAELARFARLHQHSAAGRHALEALKEMPS